MWMAICLLFVFMALVEFAYVNVHARVEKRRRNSSGPDDAQGGLRLNTGSKGGDNSEVSKTLNRQYTCVFKLLLIYFICKAGGILQYIKPINIF